jgi:hypothetical protein
MMLFDECRLPYDPDFISMATPESTDRDIIPAAVTRPSQNHHDPVADDPVAAAGAVSLVRPSHTGIERMPYSHSRQT